MVGKNFQIYDVQVTEKTFASQKLKVDIVPNTLLGSFIFAPSRQGKTTNQTCKIERFTKMVNAVLGL